MREIYMQIIETEELNEITYRMLFCFFTVCSCIFLLINSGLYSFVRVEKYHRVSILFIQITLTSDYHSI